MSEEDALNAAGGRQESYNVRAPASALVACPVPPPTTRLPTAPRAAQVDDAFDDDDVLHGSAPRGGAGGYGSLN